MFERTVAMVALCLVGAACKKSVPATPEQAVLTQLGAALQQGAVAAVALYDLELRQRADLFEAPQDEGGP